MEGTQERVYKYIKHLCESCKLSYPNGNNIDNIPVSITRQQIADKLNISEKTVQRCLKYLLDNNYIYRYELGSSVYIYNIKPINTNQDFICRVKMS